MLSIAQGEGMEKYNLKKDIENTILKTAKDSRQLMRINKILGTKYAITVTCSITSLFIFYIGNFCINLFISLFQVKNPFTLKNIFLVNFKFIFTYKFFLFIYFLLALVIIINDLRLIYLFKTNMEEQNIGQKGSSRWTTIEEIKKEFKEIQDSKIRFPGHGGIPVCRIEDKLYIDDNPTNTIHIGITRSGKGEMYVLPEIDIYSRAEIQPSLVVLDLKTELTKCSYKTLTERGYKVEVFNIENPEAGFMYNPLHLITKAYKEGDIPQAELLCNSFSHSIFSSAESAGGDADANFFLSTATSAVSALILAHVSDCLAEDKRKNAEYLIEWVKKQEDFLHLSPEEQAAIKEQFRQLQKENAATKNYLALSAIPEEADFIPSTENEQCINMYSVINTFTNLARVYINEKLTKLDLYFNSRPPLDRAKGIYASIEVAGDRTKGSIFSQALTKLALYEYDNIAKLTSKSTFDLTELGFGEKPVALFIAVPFYDRSKDSLISTMISQIFSSNSRMAAQTKTLKCKRRIIYHLDEIGNYPAIKDFKTMLSIGLGTNQLFNLFIQSYNQIDSTYGKDAATIKDNCGTHIYIQTSSNDTAEYFSKLIGKETITNITRSGTKLSLKKTITEMYEEKPLLNPNELMELMPGENVIKRAMKRQDLAGNKVKPRSIFNSIERGTVFKYRYEYLQNEFPDPDKIEMNSLPIPKTDFSKLDLETIVYDYNISLCKFGYHSIQEKMKNGAEVTPEESADLEKYEKMFRYDKPVTSLYNYAALQKLLIELNITVTAKTTIGDLIQQILNINVNKNDLKQIIEAISTPGPLKAKAVSNYDEYRDYYNSLEEI